MIKIIGNQLSRTLNNMLGFSGGALSNLIPALESSPINALLSDSGLMVVKAAPSRIPVISPSLKRTWLTEPRSTDSRKSEYIMVFAAWRCPPKLLNTVIKIRAITTHNSTFLNKSLKVYLSKVHANHAPESRYFAAIWARRESQ